MTDTRKDLPPITAPNFLERLREAVSTMLGNRGDPLNQGVTVRDLQESGMVTLRPGFATGGKSAIAGAALLVPVSPSTYVVDRTPPPMPSGLRVTAGISSITIECDVPSYTQGHGHARTRVYGYALPAGSNGVPTFAMAKEITSFVGFVNSIPTDPAQEWHIWAKWESQDAALSVLAAGGINGVMATTGSDVTNLVKAMAGTGKPFTILTDPTTIDGVFYPAGTYMTLAMIQPAQITSAMLGILTVSDSNIQSLSFSKLTTGTVAATSYAQSTGYVAATTGWKINGNGAAEFNGLVAKTTTLEGVAATGATGTGNLVFSISPTLITPALGTPSALVGTNITGTAAGLTAGDVSSVYAWAKAETKPSYTYSEVGAQQAALGSGSVALVAGVATVSLATIGAGSLVFVQRQTDGGTLGVSYSITRTAGVSFTITAINGAGATETSDTSTIGYQVF